MDGEAGWWTTSGNIGLPPLARAMGVGRQHRDMGLYEVLLSVFVGFWDRDYVSQLPCVRYYVFIESSFKHTREECESKRAYVFQMPDI